YLGDRDERGRAPARRDRKEETQMSQLSLISQPEPTWRASAYVRGDEKVLSSDDYAGKWHVLYWYPLDFTFVCPTEIKGFQSLLGEFEDDGVHVIGASTDSFYSHKAWFADR